MVKTPEWGAIKMSDVGKRRSGPENDKEKQS